MKVSVEVNFDKSEIDNLIIAKALEHAKAAAGGEKNVGGSKIEWRISTPAGQVPVVESAVVSFTRTKD